MNDVFFLSIGMSCALTPHHSSSARVTLHPDSIFPVFLQKYPFAEILKTTVPGSFWKSMELYSQRFSWICSLDAKKKFQNYSPTFCCKKGDFPWNLQKITN